MDSLVVIDCGEFVGWLFRKVANNQNKTMVRKRRKKKQHQNYFPLHLLTL
jgi:hypothetical protein